MYNIIKCPESKILFNINSPEGKNIVIHYLKYLNGGKPVFHENHDCTDNKIIENNYLFYKTLVFGYRLSFDLDLNRFPGNNLEYWTICDVPGDGHCFYWCLYRYLYLLKKKSPIPKLEIKSIKTKQEGLKEIAIIREEIYNIVKRKDKSHTDLKSMKIGYETSKDSKGCDKSGYAVDTEMMECAELFDLCICVFEVKMTSGSEKQWTIFGDQWEDGSNIIYILNTGNHFQILSAKLIVKIPEQSIHVLTDSPVTAIVNQITMMTKDFLLPKHKSIDRDAIMRIYNTDKNYDIRETLIELIGKDHSEFENILGTFDLHSSLSDNEECFYSDIDKKIIRKMGPVGKTCKPNGSGCCLNDPWINYCDWIPKVGCMPKKSPEKPYTAKTLITKKTDKSISSDKNISYIANLVNINKDIIETIYLEKKKDPDATLEYILQMIGTIMDITSISKNDAIKELNKSNMNLEEAINNILLTHTDKDVKLEEIPVSIDDTVPDLKSTSLIKLDISEDIVKHKTDLISSETSDFDSKKEKDSSEIEGWDEGLDLDLDLDLVSSTISKKAKDSSEIEGWDEGFDLDLY